MFFRFHPFANMVTSSASLATMLRISLVGYNGVELVREYEMEGQHMPDSVSLNFSMNVIRYLPALTCSFTT